MDLEAQTIINAIRELKEPANFDWIDKVLIPIVMSLIGAALGGLVAYFVYTRQEKARIEIEKMDAVNKFTLAGNEALQTLKNLKRNYWKDVNEFPLQRAVAVKTILLHAETISVDIPSLSFLAPKEAPGKPSYAKWGQLPYISDLFKNYNYALGVWTERNLIDKSCREAISQAGGGGPFVDVEFAQVIHAIGGAELARWMDLTEHLISLTDDLIIEFDDFSYNFPVYASNFIAVKKLEGYRTLLRFVYPADARFIEKCPSPDYTILAAFFGKTVAEVKEKYRTGY